MKHWIAALGLGIFLLVAPVKAENISDKTPADIAAHLATNPPTDLNEYYDLRQHAGDAKFAAVISATTTHAYKVGGLEGVKFVSGCKLPQWHAPVQAGLLLAQTATSEAEWQNWVSEVKARQTQYQTTWADLSVGKIAHPDLDGIAATLKATHEALPPSTKELAVRAARDQFGRYGTMLTDQGLLWARDASPPVLDYMKSYIYAELCATDISNTNWLKAELAQNGWFKISTHGPGADGNAWLLAQHADHDPAFQRDVLALLEPLVATGDTRPSNFAMLYDRVALKYNRPQRYGSQGRCVAAGVWEPFEVEDPAHLDERRAQVGLEPISENQKRFISICTADMAALQGQIK
ncbi:hypothetical protein OVA03_14730 [Asticcacaulis sp. SL142]|uniref:DUF6624 domain-containing protein n=1 Tax=Asticcacaulis sp. SL142 TaxID=2995155 RepID=UPI00226CED49|nr:DUF6624 domain-containing protein [Asticcacaulis sp. SL142]WAC47940.1 hypothetical protein OVA03_14730 [Asticcacaulis sp. SL142]